LTSSASTISRSPTPTWLPKLPRGLANTANWRAKRSKTTTTEEGAWDASRAGPDTPHVISHAVPVGQRMLSVPAAAQRAGVSVKTIRRAYLAGELACERPGGRRRVVIPEDRLDEWVRSGQLDIAAVRRPGRAVAAARLDSRSGGEPGSVDRLRAIEMRATP
jgi:excisionase family DNA binding protein